MNWFTRFWSRVRDAVTRFFASPEGTIARDALQQALKILGQAAFAFLLELAKAKVAELEESHLSSAQRGEVARDYLKGAAIKAGITVSSSMLNYLLETAVQAMKAHQATGTPSDDDL